MAAIAMLLPLGLGQLFTAWRADVAQVLPPALPPPVVPALEPPPEPERVPNLRSVDEMMFSLVERAFGRESQTDVRPAEPYRIDFVHSPGQPPQALVDLDRNGRFDERWTHGATIAREVSPADDGVWTERYTWDGYDWVPAATP